MAHITEDDKETEPEIRFSFLKYDRSGRSSGVAVVSFETPLQATRAKRQFDGKLAKGRC
jgi:THO complex subunit 4